MVYSESNNDLLQNRSNKSIFFSKQTKAINSVPEYDQRVCSQNNKFRMPHAHSSQIHKAMDSGCIFNKNRKLSNLYVCIFLTTIMYKKIYIKINAIALLNIKQKENQLYNFNSLIYFVAPAFRPFIVISEMFTSIPFID